MTKIYEVECFVSIQNHLTGTNVIFFYGQKIPLKKTVDTNSLAQNVLEQTIVKERLECI
jgi:hypothetical protein